MTFKTVIQPSGHNFPIEAHETILEAALRHGYTLPYSCRDGVCGTCKGKVVTGQVDYGKYQESTLSETEKAAGMALFCCAKPLSDLVLECREVTAVNDIPVRTIPCRVQKMEKPAPDVMVLSLKLPANERLQFLAGQYIDILLKDEKPRSFSLANAPHDDEFLELHIRNITGWRIHPSCVRGDERTRHPAFQGTAGHLFPARRFRQADHFRRQRHRLCTDQGDHRTRAVHRPETPDAFLLGRTQYVADLYMLDKARQWEKDGIKFTPVLSDALPEDAWQGRTGFVHQAVLDDYRDLSGHEVYTCGAPVVVEAAHRDFTALRGLPDDAFFSDAFTFTPKN